MEGIVKEPPVLLYTGQKVFRVVLGDIEEYCVHDEKSWLCGENFSERGYRLKHKKGYYGCTWNREIGKTVFKSYAKARAAAEDYIYHHDVLLAQDIKAVETVSFLYRRGWFEKDCVAFYSVLENGLLYVKNFLGYPHIVRCSSQVIQDFIHRVNTEGAVPVSYDPVFQNMYRCPDGSDWIYSAADYCQRRWQERLSLNKGGQRNGRWNSSNCKCVG